MLERKIGKADPPAAARTMTAQIVHLKQLHAKRQQLQIGGQLTGIFNIVHNGAAKLNACCNAFNLPRIIALLTKAVTPLQQVYNRHRR